jgi:aspartate/methionine/tyrosine aminotransferase
VRFPLADWIDDHAGCRHNLGRSGMIGSVALPRPSPQEVRRASAGQLAESLASGLRVDPGRLFLTHGASEANAWITLFLARTHRGRDPRVRVRFPEYPPLVDVAKWAGFRVSEGRAPAALAVVSLPRNPEGVLWTKSDLGQWTEGVRSTLIDETFREFGGTSSHASAGARGVWVSGSFTKFYGADDLRVGYAVAPPEETEAFGRFHGIVTDELPPFSVAGALCILEQKAALAHRVRDFFETNRAALARSLPAGRAIRAPVYFDPVPDGDALSRRCLRASVLVCPGSFFGSRAGVRICLTRRSFPRDLAAYLRVKRSGKLSAGI